MANKRKKKFGNAANEAAKRQKSRLAAQTLGTNLGAADAAGQVGDTSVSAPSPAYSQDQYDALLAVSKKIQEQSLDLAADFSRVLQSYTALITTSFKLSATMAEFEIEDPKSVERLKSKLNFFIEDLPRTCEKAGIRMPDVKGHDFVPALNVQALNADEYLPTDDLVIDEIIEPILIFEPKNSSAESSTLGGLLKSGLVTVKRKGE
jgi:hypothetical protein